MKKFYGADDISDETYIGISEKMAEANREAGGSARAADLIEGLELSGAAGC